MGLFGQALYDFTHHGQPAAFFVCNEQEELPLDLRFYVTPQPDLLEDALLAYAAGRCLDIGCGAGRILRYLSAKGHTVVGIDIDSPLIQLCREFGAGDVYLISWESMEPLEQFDTLLLLNRSIGIGGNLDGVKRLLAQCAASASSGAGLLFDSTEFLERRLCYKYRGQYSEAFPWVYFCCEIANKLLAETGWVSKKVIRDGGRYGVVARKAL